MTSPLVETLPNDAGYVAGRARRGSSPPPLRRLPSIRDRVAAGLDHEQASQRAQAARQTHRREGGAQAPLADAAKGASVPVASRAGQRAADPAQPVPGPGPAAARDAVQPGQGKSRMVAGGQGEGFYVVKVNKIIPGNALRQPTLITQTQQQMQESLCRRNMAQQFLNAMRQAVGVKRNERPSPTRRRELPAAGTRAGRA